MTRLFMLTAAIVLTSSLFCGIAAADNTAGDGYYGMMSKSWPCQAMRQAEKDKKVLRRSVLWRTFGNRRDCLNKDLADPRLKLIQIHIVNQTCQTNKRCDTNEILFGYDLNHTKKALQNPESKLSKAIKAEAQAVADYLLPRLGAGVDCAISPLLESTLDTDSAERAFGLVKPAFGGRCSFVWSPRAGNNSPKPPSAQVIEKHGEKPNMTAPCIANLDGVDVTLSSRPAVLPQKISSTEAKFYLSKYSYCQAAFIWIAEYNGIHKEGFRLPLKRTNWPSLATFKAANSLARATPQIEPPRPFNDADALSLKGCSKIEQPDGAGGFVYKPESDTRPNTYVAIFPAKFDQRFARAWVESQGKLYENLTFSAMANPDSHGPRQHWRSSRSSEGIKMNSVLKTSAGSCWKLSDPHFRID